MQTDIGRYHVLHGVELGGARGGVTVLLGRNGAGKTTTLRTIMGLWRARAGRIRFGGRDIAGLQHRRHRPRGHRLRARGHGHLRAA